jgi:hypothetical protein
MKNIALLFIIILTACSSKNTVAVKNADISCGQCQFNLDSEKGCSLAVKFNNTAYFVDGFNIDDFGDAHDVQKGFCNVVRTGAIEGEIKNNRFVASSLQLKD